MQKLLVITFSLIMIYVNVGYFMQVGVQKELARQEMKERIFHIIPDSSCDVFEVNSVAKQIAWKEEDKEFWLNNALYDVVKISAVDGKTYIYCINDEHEEKVIEDYRTNIEKKSASGNGQKSVTSFFAPLFINTVIPNIYTICFVSKNEFCHYKDDILQQDKKIVSPPPKA